MQADNNSSCINAGTSESIAQIVFSSMIPMFSNYPDIVTVKQVMEMLGIGRNTVYRLLETDEIRTVPIGRRYIIPRNSVVEFVIKNCYSDKEKSMAGLASVITEGSDEV